MKKALAISALSVSLIGGGVLYSLPASAQGAPAEVTKAVDDTKATMQAIGGLVTAAFAVALAPIGGSMVFKFVNKLLSNV